MEQAGFNILVVIISGISLINGIYMLLLFRNSRGVKGTGYWSAGSLMIGLGLLLNLVPPAGGFTSLVGPGIFITWGLYLYLAGIWQFKQKKIRNLLVNGMPLLNFLQSFIFFTVWPSDRIREGHRDLPFQAPTLKLGIEGASLL